MNTFLRLRTLVHVVAAIALAASGIAAAQPVLAAGALLLVAVAELACRGAISIPFLEPQGASPLRTLALPRWVTLGAIALVLIRGMWVAMNSTVHISTLCETVAWLMVIKLFDRRSVRDDAQILALAVYLCIGAVLISQRFIPSLLVAINVPVVLASVMTAELASGIARSSNTHAKLLPGSALRGVTVAAIAAIFAISIAIFVLMPRGPLIDQSRLRSFSSWAAGLGGSGRVTGFSDRIQLGRGGLISESKAIVLDVNIEEPGQASGRVRTDTLYLRGASLPMYQDGEWREYAASVDADRPVMDRPRDPMIISPGQTQVISGTAGAFGPSRVLVQRIRMRGSDRVVPLFAAWCPASIEFVTQERITIDRESLTISRQGPDAPLSYIVSSTVPVESAASALASGAQVLRGRVDRASVPASIANIARDVLIKARVDPDPDIRPATDDALAMRAMESFLRRELSYTLDLVAAPPGRDPVEWFITTEKRGNCEYFASALALMGRSVGIPTRVITGYVAAEFSEATSSYLVRQSNAHAWVEARTSPVPIPHRDVDDQSAQSPSWHGWQTYDPTPPEDFRRVHRPEPNLAGKLGQFLDSMEYFWVANVVTFDDSKQTALLDRRTTSWIEERLRTLMQVDPETGEPRQSAAKRIGTVVGTVMGATLLAVGAIGLLRWLFGRLSPRRVSADRAGSLSPSSARLYRMLDGWLTHQPASLPKGLPLLRRIRAVSDPRALTVLNSAAQALNAERFGGVTIPPDLAANYQTQIQGLTSSQTSENA